MPLKASLTAKLEYTLSINLISAVGELIMNNRASLNSKLPNHKARILHIIVGLNVGGAELMLKRLIESGEASFQEVIVVSLTTLGEIGEALRARGVKLYVLGLSRAIGFPIVIMKLIRIIRRHRPVIVQTWMYHADLLGGLAARLAGSCAVVWNIRSTAIPQGSLSFTYWLIRVCKLCSHFIPHRIICCAESAKVAHIKLGFSAHKIIVVPNGYDFSVFDCFMNAKSESRNELGFEEGDLVIGTVGRFDPLKDFHNFVNAAAILTEKRSDVKFLMIGRNIDWGNSTLSWWIKEAGLEKRFKLIGEQSAVPYYLSAMDVFCLSSVNEAFPNVVVEAMAIGLPCVVTRAGDAADILEDDNYTVPVKDSNSLAEALLRLIYLKPVDRRSLGERNARKVRAEYGIKKIQREYEKVYDEVSMK
jgi:glycosyltransferase involved in cell wall biosynthesis